MNEPLDAVQRLITGPELYHLPGFYEPFSAISHLCGAVLFLGLGGLLLWRGRGDTARLIVLGIYAVSCILLFSMSGVYHMLVRGGTPHRVLERLDHGAIFVLIAGSFTPAHGILFRGPLRWGPLALIWSAALAGIALKTIFFNDFNEYAGVGFYLVLGWLGAGSGILLGRRFGLAFIRPLLLGGVAYSVGAVAQFVPAFILVPGVIHPHEVFHVAVLLGALLHWRFIWQFATGPPPRRTSSSPLEPV